MAFYSYQYNLGDVPVMYIPSSSMHVKVGDALTIKDGKLVKATGDVKPDYISLYDGNGVATTDGARIPVEPVYPSTVYETTLTGNLGTVSVGSVHSINGSATSITNASASGAAKVIDYDGNKAGYKVRVQFIEPKPATTATASE